MRILSIGDDDSLRLSRELVLKWEGYEVESMASFDFLQSPQGRGFDVAILCQTIEGARMAQVASLLRRENPGIRILRMQIPGSRTNHFELDCEVLSGPGAFLDAVKVLCRRGEEARSAPGPDRARC